MQMYKVAFNVIYEGVIDCGTVLVCAANSEQAAEIIAFHLEIPASKATFDVSRVKPSVYTISRKEISKGVERNKAKSEIENAVWEVRASATVKARSEANAWRSFCTGILERAAAEKVVVNDNLKNLDLSCDRKEFRPKESAVERQGIFTEKRFFSGGAARPR